MRTELPPTPEIARVADAVQRGNPAPGPRSAHASARAREVAVAKAEARAEQAAADDAALKAARDEANEALGGNSSELAFEFDDGSQRIVVKLIDTRTKEVLRQIPSEQLLEIARALKSGGSAGALLHTDA